MNSEAITYEFEKGNNEKVLVGIREWKGNKYFSARVWYKPKQESKKYYPTKKGITLSLGLLPQFIGGLCTIAESEGLGVKSGDTPKEAEPSNLVGNDDTEGKS